MKETAENMRRFERFTVKNRAIKGLLCGKPSMLVRDISIGGASIVVDGPVTTDRSCMLELVSGSQVYNMVGSVIWTRDHEPKGGKDNADPKRYYSVGIKFGTNHYSKASSMIYNLLKS